MKQEKYVFKRFFINEEDYPLIIKVLIEPEEMENSPEKFFDTEEDVLNHIFTHSNAVIESEYLEAKQKFEKIEKEYLAKKDKLEKKEKELKDKIKKNESISTYQVEYH